MHGEIAETWSATCVAHGLCIFMVSSLVTTAYLHAAYWGTRPPPAWLLLMFGMRLAVDVSGGLVPFSVASARLPLLMVLESLAVVCTRTARNACTYEQTLCNTCAIMCLCADSLLLVAGCEAAALPGAGERS